MAIKRKVKTRKRAREKDQKRSAKKAMRMREKQAASLHPISQKIYTSCCKNQF